MLWKLTDVKSGEWTQVGGIKMEAVFNRIDNWLRPNKNGCFWPVLFIAGDLWFYNRVEADDTEFVLVRYNVTHENMVFIRTKMFPGRIHGTCLIPHVHTLLSPKSCI